MFGITYKDLIFNQLQSRFKQFHIERLKLEFDIETKICKGVGLTDKKQEYPVTFTDKENNLIHSMLIKKVKHAIDYDFSILIVDINMIDKTFNSYTNDKNNNLQKINIF